jgi:hypothetical protein
MTATSAVSLHHAEKVTADIRCLEKLIDRYLKSSLFCLCLSVLHNQRKEALS